MGGVWHRSGVSVMKVSEKLVRVCVLISDDFISISELGLNGV